MFFIKATDGIKIAVYEYNCRGRETIFLVHGWPLSNKIFEYQVNMLVDNGYHVIAIDLRGFGNSDAPASGYCYNQMAMDIHSVVTKMGLHDFSLVGFSMGGAIVLRYMKLCAGLGVKKLILLAAAAPSWTQRPGYPYGLTRREVNQLLCLAETDRPQLAYNFSHNQLFANPQSNAVKAWFEDIALSASGIGTIKTGLSLRDEDGRKDLACVSVPTWIIHGDKDIVVSKDLAEYQHKCIQNSGLMHLANSGHGIMYDELEKFNCCFLKAICTVPECHVDIIG